tara:strand:- start:792 stop:1454 length:663 start_codon:yes stop_codon:yes gene_type:complete
MLLNLDSQILLLLIPALVFSLCVHEFSHGIIAYYYGDDTAYRYGRLTLNPLKHLDPIGSLMLLFIGFGYAKPVPVNPLNLNNPRHDMIKVAAAGPISNLILAFTGTFVLYFIFYLNPYFLTKTLNMFFQLFIQINIFLAIFNLLPIYPLDGGQIFGNILSKKFPEFNTYMQLYGPRILMIVIFIGIFSGYSIISLVLSPIYEIVNVIFVSIVKLILSPFI